MMILASDPGVCCYLHPRPDTREPPASVKMEDSNRGQVAVAVIHETSANIHERKPAVVRARADLVVLTSSFPALVASPPCAALPLQRSRSLKTQSHADLPLRVHGRSLSGPTKWSGSCCSAWRRLVFRYQQCLQFSSSLPLMVEHMAHCLEYLSRTPQRVLHTLNLL